MHTADIDDDRLAPDDAADANALDELLFADPGSTTARAWCHGPSEDLAARAATVVRDRVEAAGRARVVDYGAGTGLISIYLAAALDKLGCDAAWREQHVCLSVADLPGPWFTAGTRLRPWWPNVERVLLRDDQGQILALDDALSTSGMAEPVDLVIASMVLHLIPPKALDRAVLGIGQALAPGGTFLWSSPDTAPAAPGTVLFHDANRRIRQAFELLADPERAGNVPLSVAERAALAPALATAATVTEATTADANRQVPAVASTAASLEQALAPRFTGRLWREQASISAADYLRAATIPSNLKVLGEIPALDDRRTVAAVLHRVAMDELLGAGMATGAMANDAAAAAVGPSEDITGNGRAVAQVDDELRTLTLTWTLGEYAAR